MLFVLLLSTLVVADPAVCPSSAAPVQLPPYDPQHPIAIGSRRDLYGTTLAFAAREAKCEASCATVLSSCMGVVRRTQDGDDPEKAAGGEEVARRGSDVNFFRKPGQSGKR
ncbi:hypothetical protein Cob_v001340 [Colletotrichum orbiculare MAFF 240422]|uniref:Uncharacterized protein n=1 Tax=Colletotrichum orbiculare (strain 104-T / ATCC 96160 / CBS 514.97 / LARS 414 / MAFF 240422) TaxID=1213857 RepID=A0A484G858_COLOR|nr:hypothetical protein Cob_v001340 [Colletotrichum orbiculare MAFF 240422]